MRYVLLIGTPFPLSCSILCPVARPLSLLVKLSPQPLARLLSRPPPRSQGSHPHPLTDLFSFSLELSPVLSRPLPLVLILTSRSCSPSPTHPRDSRPRRLVGSFSHLSLLIRLLTVVFVPARLLARSCSSSPTC
ncbi:hypothetical protein C8Q78DRAFT_1044032 [Trametes maxima]|nr:hypothetical protein C8Q78DRAFT_1044032 [Trametes maxima]